MHLFSFRDILAVLQTAKSSVDVCLYNLTHPDLEETLINLIKKNVQVRCVFGSRKNDEKQFVKKLHKSGRYIFHHKFIFWQIVPVQCSF